MKDETLVTNLHFSVVAQSLAPFKSDSKSGYFILNVVAESTEHSKLPKSDELNVLAAGVNSRTEHVFPVKSAPVISYMK